MSDRNPIGLRGIEFIELAGPDPEQLRRIFRDFGFSKTLRHKEKAVDFLVQGDIHILVNDEGGSFARAFSRVHGPSIAAMGWRVADAGRALDEAVRRGARRAETGDYRRGGKPVPAIYGIGDSLIYFIERGAGSRGLYGELGFTRHPTPDVVPGKGFTAIDHLTNNVAKGTMAAWADFYKSIFGFTEVRYFDIRGAKTGLTSYALRSPCGTFCIPINEGTDSKSQIDEYLREYKGPGVQHLAFLTDDIVASLEAMRGSSVAMLDMDAEYYEDVFRRVPNVTEDRRALRDLNVLVDGDQEGYLLQIFTKNLIGPIFIEIIQRKNHLAFGEGNFGALFRSIERDQERRGVL